MKGVKKNLLLEKLKKDLIRKLDDIIEANVEVTEKNNEKKLKLTNN